MRPEKWHRIKEVFGAALEQRPEERAGFVQRSCGGDLELQAEVESLLSFHRDGETAIQDVDSLPKSTIECSPNNPEAMAGRHFGPYRLVREIGRGGMAVVHLAVGFGFP